MNYRRAGIVVKPHPDVLQYIQQTLAVLQEHGVECTLERAAASLIQYRGRSVELSEIARHSDILIVLGGDGTFLSAAPQAVEAGIPVAGFNLGTLGFLTELKKETLPDSLNDILSGRGRMSERKVLAIRSRDRTYLALNDVVVHKGQIARVIKLKLHLNRMPVAEVRGDGLIVATPTGSTAYSLSAGGPILSPEVNGVVITPICPHSLTFRPLIVPDHTHLAIQLLTANVESYLTIDGQIGLPMIHEEVVEIGVHPKKLQMIVSSQLSYFQLISEKLNWAM
jgi:NAD+ kinase